MSSEEALKKIWETSSLKAPDGNRYLIFKNKGDLDYLYCSGFVDAVRHTMESWTDSFSDSLMPNGAYMVGFDQWMNKEAFHYSGPVGVPFDPMALREGEWSEEEMQGLIQDNILPSVFFTKEEFFRIFEEEKKGGLVVKGKYVITKAVKTDWLEFLNTYPSPMRVLELMVEDAKQAENTGQTLKSTPPGQQAAQKLQQLINTNKSAV